MVGFFAGNDLQDAERFERFTREGGASSFPPLGWRFKEVVARFDQLYLASLYQGAAGLFRQRAAADPSPLRAVGDYSGEDPELSPASGSGFDRGLFTVVAAGGTVRFAFLPPYLNCLKLSVEDLQASRGWELTRASYQEMDRRARSQGSELVVVFVPSKAQVYLPLLQTSFPAGELEGAFRLCFRDQPYAPALEAIVRNRLALNQLMRAFCAAEGIAFLDLTPELQATVEAGRNVYFPDDSHWNAAGHERGAVALAGFMRSRGL